MPLAHLGVGFLVVRLPAGVDHASTEREMPWEGILERQSSPKCRT